MPVGSIAPVARRAMRNSDTHCGLVLSFIRPTGKVVARLYRSSQDDVSILNRIGQRVAGGLYTTIEVIDNGIGVLCPLCIQCGMTGDAFCGKIPASDTCLFLKPAAKGVASGRWCSGFSGCLVIWNYLTVHGLTVSIQIKLNSAGYFFPHSRDNGVLRDNDFVAHIVGTFVNIPM